MGSQQFCLRWNNHQMNMLNVFDQLLHNGDFVDVTLSCTGGNIKAHKMVLSACSPYFQELFRDNPCKHPIVILKDMKIVELRSIVDFMYKGEINVSQDQLPTLLKTAESLKIKGLAEVSSSGSGSQIEQTVDSSGSSVREVNGSVDQNGTEQSDGKSSPHLRRKRHRPTRKASNEDSANEEPEEKMEKTKDSSKSSLLKSEPLEANEPQIELMGDQFSRYDTGDQEASSNDGNTRISQPDFETSQPSTSGALGTSTGRGGNKRNGRQPPQQQQTQSVTTRKKTIGLKGAAVGTSSGGRKESTVWSYYSCDDDSKIVACLLCQRPFKKPGNTTNLFDHLKRRHFGHWLKLEGNGAGPSYPEMSVKSTPTTSTSSSNPKTRSTRPSKPGPKSIYAKQYKTNLRRASNEHKAGGSNNNSNNNVSSEELEDSYDVDHSTITLDVEESVAAETLQAAQGLAATAARLSIPF